ncbi:MAG: hypothetical protein R6U15_08335 [Candidatus Izemoplasmatales bacterium]
MVVHSKQIEYQNVFIANEIPSGIIDGINKDFILEYEPVNDSLIVRLSGLVQVPGISKDYFLSGKTISFNKAPKIGQEIIANYFK